MENTFLILLVSALLTTNSWGSDKYISLDLGRTQSDNPKNSDLSDYLVPVDRINKSNTSSSILFGSYLTEHQSIELGYSNLGDTLSFSTELTNLSQQSEAYYLQTRIFFLEKNHFSVAGYFGLAKWSTRIYQSAETDLIITPLNNSLSGTSSLKSSGYTAKAGLDISYRISDAISIGVEYTYFDRIGKNAGLVDFDKLAVGDLAGALRPINAKTNLDIYSIKLTMRF